MEKVKKIIYVVVTVLFLVAGIILGSGLAYQTGSFSWIVFILAIVTALCLQMTSRPFPNTVAGLTSIVVLSRSALT